MDRERLVKGLTPVETLTPEDVFKATEYVKAQGLAVRSEIFAGQSGETFYIDDIHRKEIIGSMIEGLTEPKKSTDENGLLRICIVTNGLYITEKKLDELFPYKDYLRFAFSVDSTHHNASGLCCEKTKNTIDIIW